MRQVKRGLELGALFSLGIAYPLFEVLARGPEFFVARSTTLALLIGLTALVCVGLPLLVVLVEVLAATIEPRAGTAVHYVAVVILLGATLMPWLKRLEVVGTASSIVFAVVAAVGLATAHYKWDSIRSFFVALSPAVVVVPALFVLNEDVWSAVVPATEPYAAPAIASAPTIVFIVFDEFPLNSLLDEDYRVDADRFPNFAALASDSYWFRNATTVSSQTVWAVPAIVSGRYPVEVGAVPTRRYYPNNLFTLLSNRYEITLFGRFLQLCPEGKCRYDLETPGESMSALLADLSIVYLHIIAPDGLQDRLPPIVGDWRGFATRRLFRSENGERARNERSSEFDRFLAAIGPQKEGRLYFLHSLLPHTPFEYVPSGRRYSAPSVQVSGLFLTQSQAFADYVQQRHLLQVGFVDLLIGKLIARLQELGIYDSTLIVITGDHGSSFREGSPRRGLSDDNYSDIMLVPLFIKLPSQEGGMVSDRNVETVDIVPTIASELSIHLPYDVDGRSALDSGAPDRDRKSFVQRSLGRIRVFAFDDAIDASYTAWEHKLDVFGAGTWDGVYALRSEAGLIGEPVEPYLTRRTSPVGLQVADPGRLEAVDSAATYLPLWVHGRVSGATAPIQVAVAVNGHIAAVASSYESDDGWVFSTLIPEESLVSGSNSLDVYVVDKSATRFELLQPNPFD